MISPATTSREDNNAFVTAYEELRLHAITRSTGVRHFGLVLLLREGVAAWMARCSACAAARTPAADRTRSAAPILREELKANLVGVLASMAMATRQEMHA